MNDKLKGKTVGIEMWDYLSTRTRLLFKTMAAKTLANHLANTNQPHCDYARFELIVDNTVAYVRDVRAAIDGNVVMYLEGIHPGKVAATERAEVRSYACMRTVTATAWYACMRHIIILNASWHGSDLASQRT